MKPWRLAANLAALAALSGTVVLAGWEATVGIRLGSSSIEDAASPIADHQTTRDTKSLSVATKSIDIPLASLCTFFRLLQRLHLPVGFPPLVLADLEAELEQLPLVGSAQRGEVLGVALLVGR